MSCTEKNPSIIQLLPFNVQKLFSFSGVVNQCPETPRVWDEITNRLPAYRTSGNFLSNVILDMKLGGMDENLIGPMLVSANWPY